MRGISDSVGSMSLVLPRIVEMSDSVFGRHGLEGRIKRKLSFMILFSASNHTK